MLKDAKIGTRLWMGFGIVLFLLVLTGAIGQVEFHAVSDKTTTADQATQLMFVIVALAVLLGLAVSYLTIRSITGPLQSVIGGLRNGAEEVAAASSQVSSSSRSLAEGASEQASSLEETSSSLEEMSSMTKQNAENANQADGLMKTANQVVEGANGSMKELTRSMEEITRASEETSKIIKTIDEIAFQTNLLALNAAVEAARAGEAGAGFAVVAGEVRNLALRAADAAKNTAGLIEGTVKKVKDGSQLVVVANEAFGKVAESSAKVGGLIAEIAAASNEQGSGIEQVNKAVAEMDKVVQQNAASAEESASASETMSSQAQQLRGFVDNLVALVGGSKADSAVKSRASEPKNRKASLTPVARRAKAAPSLPAGRELKPEQLIPLGGEEGDFKDF
jgi:methyl-accepting chemotaxis protein